MYFCTVCKEKLDASCFNKDKSRSTGLDATCRKCRKDQRKAYKDQYRDIVVPSHKVCSCCKINKESSQFHKKTGYPTGLHTQCKDCVKKKMIEKKEENLSKKLPDDYKKLCNNCNTMKDRNQFLRNIYSTDGIGTICGDCERNRSKVWRNNNKDKVIEYRSREYFKNYKNRRNSRPQVKVSGNIRNRIRIAIKRQDSKKYHETYKLIGCSLSFIKEWLEWQFNEDMTWENYGTYWHIDHVIPCSSFDLSEEEQQFECFNWRNCRPCKAEINLSKNDEIQTFQIVLQEMKVHYYEQHNQIAGIS